MALERAETKVDTRYMRFLRGYFADAKQLIDTYHIDLEKHKSAIADAKSTAPKSLPPAAKDVRVKSHLFIDAARVHGVLSEISRVFNQFPLDYKSEPVTHPNITKEYIPFFYSLIEEGLEAKDITATGEDLEVVITVHPFVLRQLEKLAANLIYLACEELLDEKGELNADLLALTGIDKVITDWNKDAKFKKRIPEILPQVITSYFTQVATGNIAEKSKYKVQSDAKKIKVQAHLLCVLENIIFKRRKTSQGDIGEPTHFLLEHIELFQFYRNFTACLEKLSPQVIIDLIQVDVHESIRGGLCDVRIQFWRNVVEHLVRYEEANPAHIALAKTIGEGLNGQHNVVAIAKDAPAEAKVIDATNKIDTVRDWLVVRDNVWHIDNFILNFVHSKSLSEKEYTDLQGFRYSVSLLSQPLETILKRALPARQSDVNAYLKLFPNLEANKVVKQVPWNGVIWPGAFFRLPSRMSVSAEKKLDFSSNEEKAVYENLKSGMKPFLERTGNQTKLYKKLAPAAKDEKTEAKSLHILQCTCMRELLRDIENGLTAKPQKKMLDVINTWKSTVVGPYYFDEQGKLPAAATNYGLARVYLDYRGWGQYVWNPELKVLVDQAVQKLSVAAPAAAAKATM